mgnify:CR=1 FL=1
MTWYKKKKEKQYTSVENALIKMSQFCAYQERTQQEVRQKLLDEYILNEDEREFIIVRLIEENFLNEERFAKVFAGSKFRVKKWGRRKILQALKMKGISEYCIRAGMKEIEEEDYVATLMRLLDKKMAQSKEKDTYKLKQVLARYAINKGYEQDLVWEQIKQLLDDAHN